MGIRIFDRKFGKDFLESLPNTPAVYLFKDGHGDVIYVGKALNIRRRLQSYRNARRLKKDRKMNAIIKDSVSIEIRKQDNEFKALILENELIRKFRPKHNVDGAFQFLYPAFGTGQTRDQLYLCLTSNIDRYNGIPMTWFGCFRSRKRCKAAYESLFYLLGLIGHTEPPQYVKATPGMRGSHISAFRRINFIKDDLEDFFAGSSLKLLSTLTNKLLQKAHARKHAASVQASLETLAAFYKSDAQLLNKALATLGEAPRLVQQDERDILFINYRQEVKEELPRHRQADKL